MTFDRRKEIKLKKRTLGFRPWTLDSSLFLFLITAVVLLYGVIYPNIHIVLGSLQFDGSWSIASYREVLTQGIVIESVITSLGVSILTVVFCALVGVPLAFLFERYTFPFRRFFAALAALPLVLPPLVGTVAFILLCGESDLRVIQTALHLETPPWTLRGWAALLLFHTYTMYPFFYVLSGAGLRRIDAGLSEAARGSGGESVISVVSRNAAAVNAVSNRSWAINLHGFNGVVQRAPIFGGNVRVLTLEIFTARQRGDARVALTETVLLAVISLSALLFFQRYEGTRRFAAAPH